MARNRREIVADAQALYQFANTAYRDMAQYCHNDATVRLAEALAEMACDHLAAALRDANITTPKRAREHGFDFYHDPSELCVIFCGDKARK